MRKIVVALAVILILALVGVGAAYYTGSLDLPFGAASPTPPLISLADPTEPTEEAPLGLDENEAESTEETAGADDSAISESEEIDDQSDESAASEDTEADEAGNLADDSADTEDIGSGEGRQPTRTPVFALPSPTRTPTAMATPTAAPTATPTATPTSAVVVQAPVQEEASTGASQNLAPTLPIENMAGEWEFNFGTMSLNQSGVSVSGIYRWYGDGNHGRITGSFIYGTNQFRGLWINNINPTEQGFVDWRLVDEQTFIGTFENNSVTGQFCGVRAGEALPPGCGFSGAWNLHFGSPGIVAGRANLTQTGNWVSGSYMADDGRTGEIEGTVSLLEITEAILSGTWRTATGESGPFEWRINQTTNRAFEGRRLDDNSEWCGWREGAEKPEPCGF